MNDYKRVIVNLVVALSMLMICLNLLVQVLDSGTRELYKVAEEYGIELEESSNVIVSGDVHSEAPIIQNDISLNFDVNLVSISLAGILPAFLLVMKKMYSKFSRKKSMSTKESVNISKLQ